MLLFAVTLSLSVFFLGMGVVSLLTRSAVGESLENAKKGRRAPVDLRKRLAGAGNMVLRLPLIKDFFNPEALEKKLLMTGSRFSPVEFLGLQAAASAGGALLAAASGRYWFVLGPALMLVGFAMPRSRLDRKAGEAASALERDFILFLEKVAQGVTAGISFARACERAVSGVSGFLRSQVLLMVENLKGNMPEERALNAFACRLDIPEAENFSRVVKIGLGNGDERLGGLLVELARNVRDRRDSRSQEVSRKLEYQLLFPAVPTLFIASFLEIGAPLLLVMGKFFK